MGETQNEAGAGRLRRTTGTNMNVAGRLKVAEYRRMAFVTIVCSACR
jgi:hypothetical protein